MAQRLEDVSAPCNANLVTPLSLLRVTSRCVPRPRIYGCRLSRRAPWAAEAMFRTVIMMASSLALTTAVVAHAYYLKHQFYPTVVYLTKSSPSMAVSIGPWPHSRGVGGEGDTIASGYLFLEHWYLSAWTQPCSIGLGEGPSLTSPFSNGSAVSGCKFIWPLPPL